MYSGPEHREKLKQDAKNFLFDQNFQEEVQRQIAEKKAKGSKTLVEKLGQDGAESRDRLSSRFDVTGDDDNKTLMWRSLMKDCAFYYDAPTLEDELKMKRTLQRKYDPLF